MARMSPLSLPTLLTGLWECMERTTSLAPISRYIPAAPSLSHHSPVQHTSYVHQHYAANLWDTLPAMASSLAVHPSPPSTTTFTMVIAGPSLDRRAN